MFEGLRESVGCGAEDEGGSGGEFDREGGCSVFWVGADGCDDVVSGCFFFCFLREDSLPLASELSGDPGRLRFVEEEEGFKGSPYFVGR